jgi:hypothetical protein
VSPPSTRLLVLVRTGHTGVLAPAIAVRHSLGTKGGHITGPAGVAANRPEQQ